MVAFLKKKKVSVPELEGSSVFQWKKEKKEYKTTTTTKNNNNKKQKQKQKAKQNKTKKQQRKGCKPSSMDSVGQDRLFLAQYKC